MLATRTGAEEFTATFARVATSVAVVSTRTEDDAPVGVTVGSLTSVSLEPPLLLVCLGSGMFLPGAIARSGRFAVSVLGADGQGLAERFAGMASDVQDRFAGIETVQDAHGMPLLPGSVAWFGCSPWATYDGGDHHILVGRVTHQRHWPDRRPLLRHNRGWSTIDARDPTRPGRPGC